MNLISPGVQVTVIDESIYASSGPGTVPLIVLATAENKLTSDGTTMAAGTLKSNSEKLVLVSSQRELTQLFGDPQFLSVGGAAINGSPLNEYGLLAAHSFLGISNRAYVIRADIDLNQLQPTVVEPTSPVAAGTYWLNTDSTDFGLHEFVVDPFDPSAGVWASADISYIFTGTPSNAVGANGEYAVELNSTVSASTFFFYKKVAGAWVALGDLLNGTAPVKIVSGPVYPSMNQYFATFTGTDVGFAYWLNSSTMSAGAKIVMSQSTVSSEFVQLTVPVVAYDFTSLTGAIDADNAASAALGASLASGSVYARVYALPAHDPLASPFTAIDPLQNPNSVAGPNPEASGDSVAAIALFKYDGSKWIEHTTFIAQADTPVAGPVEGTYWYNPDVGLDADGVSTVDLLVNDGLGAWINVEMPGVTGYNGDSSSITAYTQSLNPLEMTPVPVLANGDIWINTAAQNYPEIFVWRVNKWVKVDQTNQTTPTGILFADARPNPTYVVGVSAAGVNNGGASGPDLDMDAPDPDAYPKGMLLWNTRYSTSNVKVYRERHPVYQDVNDEVVYQGRWVTASGNNYDGSLIAGDDAQRRVVSQKLQGVLASNDEIRSEAIYFNLLSTPGFPECMDEMITLNIDRKETAFVVGDSPFTLSPRSSDLQAWAKNINNAAENGSVGLVSADPYLGVYYPGAALTTNLDGVAVVVPSSHIALRTIAYNDQVAYQWFAPAGLQRGRVQNATSVGYIDDEGEYVTISLNQGQRDVLYESGINPIVQFPGQGLIVYGQKTRNPFASAMDRINVARLTNYLRFQLDIVVRPFLFEPNDKITRDNVKDVVERFMAEIVTLRGITDFLVQCDESNNTPARIDRNELWCDIYVVPTKSVEFIYIPIRIRNTGGI